MLGSEIIGREILKEDRMTTKDEMPTAPHPDEVQAALERAEDVREKIEDYREAAEQADAAYSRANEHRAPSLEDLPFGEDLIRTEDFPTLLVIAEESLRAILDQRITGADSAVAFQSAVETIDDAAATLDDCTRIQDSNGDDD